MIRSRLIFLPLSQIALALKTRKTPVRTTVMAAIETRDTLSPAKSAPRTVAVMGFTRV
jgi:hypothetical protein